jgi:hypothetical protein
VADLGEREGKWIARGDAETRRKKGKAHESDAWRVFPGAGGAGRAGGVGVGVGGGEPLRELRPAEPEGSDEWGVCGWVGWLCCARTAMRRNGIGCGSGCVRWTAGQD